MAHKLTGIIIAFFCMTASVFPESTDDYTSSTIGKLLYIPAGTFQRDNSANNTSTVTAFRMSEKEISRAQFTKVTGLADSSEANHTSGIDDPIQMVSWFAALVFCNKLSIIEGLTPVYTINGDTNPKKWGTIPRADDDLTFAAWNAVSVNWSADGYRLPTEMEWMWAAIGADIDNPGKVNTPGYSKKFAGDTGNNRIEDYAWYGWKDGNAGQTTHPVGTKQPNELGLYDMSGNIREWCWDRYTKDYPIGTVTDYKGAPSGIERVYRGGCWYDKPLTIAIAYRNDEYFKSASHPYNSDNATGFRVVRR